MPRVAAQGAARLDARLAERRRRADGGGRPRHAARSGAPLSLTRDFPRRLDVPPAGLTNLRGGVDRSSVRPHSPRLRALVVRGAELCCARVIDLGVVTTPQLHHCVAQHNAGALHLRPATSLRRVRGANEGANSWVPNEATENATVRRSRRGRFFPSQRDFSLPRRRRRRKEKKSLLSWGLCPPRRRETALRLRPTRSTATRRISPQPSRRWSRRLFCSVSFARKFARACA